MAGEWGLPCPEPGAWPGPPCYCGRTGSLWDGATQGQGGANAAAIDSSGSARRRADWRTDDVAGHNELHAAVLRAPLTRVVGCDRLTRAIPLGRNAVAGDPLRNQILADGVGTLLRQLLIRLQGAG